MLNTIPLKKKNNNSYLNESNNIFTDQEIIKSFHSNEMNIFNNQQECIHDPILIDNFNFNEITKKYSTQLENNKITIDNDPKLMININKNLKKISLYDPQNNFLGAFTIYHIIKYLGNVYDSKKQFLKDIDPISYNQGKFIIKKFIFKLRYNKTDHFTDILLNDFSNSEFMGDFEFLKKINKLLFIYQNQEMQTDLANVDHKNKKKIEQNIKKFIFLLLNYTLKLISIISYQIKDNNNLFLKQNLYKYSFELVSIINLFVQDQLKIINTKNDNIKQLLDSNILIKNSLKQKIQILVDLLKLNNNHI